MFFLCGRIESIECPGSTSQKVSLTTLQRRFLEIIILCRIRMGYDVISRVNPLWDLDKVASFGADASFGFCYVRTMIYGKNTSDWCVFKMHFNFIISAWVVTFDYWYLVFWPSLKKHESWHNALCRAFVLHVKPRVASGQRRVGILAHTSAMALCCFEQAMVSSTRACMVWLQFCLRIFSSLQKFTILAR